MLRTFAPESDRHMRLGVLPRSNSATAKATGKPRHTHGRHREAIKEDHLET
ncbi:MAG TPA: hypothetical protein VK193_13185 [Methyloceanibacter sp.]|jgi:hypothetical protein|nr:hypothetical protein [Methyloceanibacter sp.]